MRMAFIIKLVLENGFEKILAEFEDKESTQAYLAGFAGGRGFVQAVLADHISCQEALDLGYSLGKGSDAEYQGFQAGKENDVGKLDVQ